MSERDEIAGLVIADAGQSFTGDDFRSLRQPGVYVFMLGAECLYVGMATRLLGRIGGNHHRKEAIAECDRVLLWPCVSKPAAARLEEILIAGLNPRYNKRKRFTAMCKHLGLRNVGRAALSARYSGFATASEIQ